MNGSHPMVAFAHTALAQHLVQALQGKALLGDAHNALFLAAPHRTGKRTLLQGDLRPALQAAEVAVVYVNLQADMPRHPGALIADAIARALQPHMGPATPTARTARQAGLKTVKQAGTVLVLLAAATASLVQNLLLKPLPQPL
jgi:hypothetical protein